MAGLILFLAFGVSLLWAGYEALRDPVRTPQIYISFFVMVLLAIALTSGES